MWFVGTRVPSETLQTLLTCHKSLVLAWRAPPVPEDNAHSRDVAISIINTPKMLYKAACSAPFVGQIYSQKMLCKSKQKNFKPQKLKSCCWTSTNMRKYCCQYKYCQRHVITEIKTQWFHTKLDAKKHLAERLVNQWIVGWMWLVRIFQATIKLYSSSCKNAHHTDMVKKILVLQLISVTCLNSKLIQIKALQLLSQFKWFPLWRPLMNFLCT